MQTTTKIRNVAIIAHVDHGKTTLVNRLLQCGGVFRQNETIIDRVMDNNDLEKERGITILAKTTSINYHGYRINILDTPGHADFSGEVERIMNMVDGCLLLVDALEGVMPQTRFVLKKAIEANVKPIVIINKVDRPGVNIQKTVDNIFNLFIELNAPDNFLDYKTAYTSALKGTSSLDSNIETQENGMEKVLDLIISEIPSPNVDENGPLKFQVTLLDYNDFVGRIGIGIIKRGKIKLNDTVAVIRLDGTIKKFRILKLFGFFELKRIEITEASAGDIIAIAGLEDINVGETICDPNNLEKEPPFSIEKPTLQMTFSSNSSPFSGKDGKFVTARMIEERLFKEAQRDISLEIKKSENGESWVVSGRGELHLGILIENMRREGYEIEISKPIPIIREENGVKAEPYEDVIINVPNEYQGAVMESIGSRSGNLIDMIDDGKNTRFIYVISSKNLLGYSSVLMTLTKGYGVLTHSFKEYRPIISSNKTLNERKIGVLVSTASGTATAYAIEKMEKHGVMFIEPGTQCYTGMIVGENCYNNDLSINPTLEKQKTNMRSASKDTTVVLKAPRKISLEYCLNYINFDELIEVTPHFIRMRKKNKNA
ncbi:MAG: translational GTPase TypA [Bacilli bacterium]|nr:translational GTPase TypA [Bacilli bacterium]